MNDAPETRLSLLQRVRDAGDRDAWEEFVTIYEPLIYRLARRRGLQDADAREVSQEVLLAVAGAIGRWEPTAGRGSFRGWLFRIARNAAINFLIKQQRHPRGSGDTFFLQLLDEQPGPAPDETAVFQDEYRRQLFRRAADIVQVNFQEKTWAAFWRTSVEGEPIKQVAADLQLSVGSVYAARSRVTAKINEEVRRLEAHGQS
jgi:RNA polymerase sigma factor (sigma-70 family)